MKRMEYGIKI